MKSHRLRIKQSLGTQGLLRLEKYLNLECFLEKSLKIKSALESTGKPLKSLGKSFNSTIFCRISTVDRDLNHYKIVVPLLVQHVLHQIKAQQFYIIF